MKSRIALVVLILSGASPLIFANRNFVPDWTFKGSSLTGLRTLGHAEWRATNGEIFGTPTSADGGWLFLDKTLQDVQFAANVHCRLDCIAGVMVRAEETPTAWLAFASTSSRSGSRSTRTGVS